MKLIIGLGNPGEKYDSTRHNLGFRVVDELGERGEGKGESWKFEKKLKAEILTFTLNASRFTLVKPQTYMNNSGESVKAIADFYKIPVSEIIVIHDDLDLPLGKIKIRIGGSAGGHHGVESIINSLKDEKFIRVRLGIGNLHSQRSERDLQHVDIERFVLESFLPQEKSKVKSMIKSAVKAVELTLEQGVEIAQNQYN